MAQITKDMLVKLVAAGLKDSEIAERLQVTQSAVSQAIEAHDIRRLATETNACRKYEKHDDLLDDIEFSLGRSLKQAVAISQFQDPIKTARLLQIVNQVKRRSNAGDRDVPHIGTVVNLQLPERLTVQFRQNSHGEVIEVDNRPLITMPAQHLLSLVRDNKKTEVLEHVDADSPKPFDVL